MRHPDEGTIHAWLDDALPPAEAAELEAHVASCADCAAAVAEARGLVAASSRILSALDDVPAGVVPGDGAIAPAAALPGNGAAPDVIPLRPATPAAPARRSFRVTPRIAAAAAVLLVAGASATLLRRDATMSSPSTSEVAMAGDSAVPPAPSVAAHTTAESRSADLPAGPGPADAPARREEIGAGAGADASRLAAVSAPGERTVTAPPPPQAVLRDAAPATDGRAFAAAARARARGDVAGQAAAALAGPVPTATAPAASPTLEAAAKVAAALNGPRLAASFAGCWELVSAPWLASEPDAPRRFRLSIDSAGAGYLARPLPTGASGTWSHGPHAGETIALAMPGWQAPAVLARSADGTQLSGGGVTARRSGC